MAHPSARGRVVSIRKMLSATVMPTVRETLTRALVLCLLLSSACAAPPTRDDVPQTAIQSGFLACQASLNDPKTQWGDGAKEYCERVVNGCPK